MPRTKDDPFIISSGPPTKTRRSYPKICAADWEEHRDTIMHLFITEKKNISDIMAALLERNFRVRKPQLKHKLLEWGLSLSLAQRQFVREQNTQRHGKKTAYRLKKGLVTLDQTVIDSCLERNRIKDDDVPLSLDSPDIVAYTPPTVSDDALSVASPVMEVVRCQSPLIDISGDFLPHHLTSAVTTWTGGLTEIEFQIAAGFSYIPRYLRSRQYLYNPYEEPQEIPREFFTSDAKRFLSTAIYLISNNNTRHMHGERVLQVVIQCKLQSMLRRLLAINLATTRIVGSALLINAVELGDIDTTRMLLELGTDPNRTPKYFYTALQIAARNGNAELTKRLLECGASVDARQDPPLGNRVAWTPLQLASASGSRETVSHLLDAGADINFLPYWVSGRTALQGAAEMGDYEMVHLLLDRGASVNHPPAHTHGRTALQAAVEKNHIEIIRLLLREGADPCAEAADSEGVTIIGAAAGSNNVELLKLSLHAGADPNILSYYGQAYRQLSPLAIAVSQDNFEAMDMLKNGGARVHDTDLHAAAFSGDLHLVRYLIDSGADIDAVDGREGSALCVAARHGHLDTVKFLVQAGAKLNEEDSGGSTALQLAVAWNHVAIVELLLQAGACFTRDEAGKCNADVCCHGRGHHRTPPILDLATAKIWLGVDMIGLLLDAGARPTAQSLHQVAKRRDSLLILQLLVERSIMEDDNRHPVDHIYDGAAFYAGVVRNDLEKAQLSLEAVTAVVNHQSVIQRAANSASRRILAALTQGSARCRMLAIYNHVNILDAIKKTDIPRVRALLEVGTDVNARYPDDSRPLLRVAIDEGNIEIVTMLLAAGANFVEYGYHDPGFNGVPSYRTALQRAAELGYMKIFAVLLAAGADPNAAPYDQGGITALQGAAAGGHVDIAQKLLQAGADVRAPGAKVVGRTALEIAAEHGRLHMVYLLIRAFPCHDDFFRDQCISASRYAKFWGHFEIAGILRDFARNPEHIHTA